MGDDDLADGVGVDEADIEDKGDEVVVQDDRLEVEIEGDEDPGHEIRYEAVEGFVSGLGALSADIQDVESAGTKYIVSFKGRPLKEQAVGGRNVGHLCRVLKQRTIPPYTMNHSLKGSW